MSDKAEASVPSEELKVETEIQISTEILIMLFLLMLSITCGHFLKKSKHKYLQEAGLTTIIGMLCGLILQLLNFSIYMKKISTHFQNLFMILLLPPIIFESGYNMNKKSFFRNIGTVLMFSFVGTFVAIFSSSAMFYLFGKWFPDNIAPSFTLRESFAFGSLISATDPVSVLAIFKELNADPNLYAIVFGESIFNDAIGIVMYETVAGLGKDENSSMGFQVWEAVIQFNMIFIGSILIGSLSALFVAFIQKKQSIFIFSDDKTESTQDHSSNSKSPANIQQQLDNDTNPYVEQKDNSQSSMNKRRKQYVDQKNFNTEISMMIMCPWVSYLIADGLQLSGIVAILVNGVFLNIYATPNITKGSRKVLMIAYETIAYSAETMVFIFLGIGVFAFDHPTDKMTFWTALLTIFNLLFARFLNIMIVSSLTNCTRSKTRIDSKQKFVMWVAGLRGAMAYALGLESVEDYGMAGKIMLSLTLIFSLLTILGVGSILNPLLQKCDVTSKPGEVVENNNNEQGEGKRRCCQNFKRIVYNFNENFFAPVFIRREDSPIDLHIQQQDSDFGVMSQRDSNLGTASNSNSNQIMKQNRVDDILDDDRQDTDHDVPDKKI